eukprot:EG_transcript_54164
MLAAMKSACGALQLAVHWDGGRNLEVCSWSPWIQTVELQGAGHSIFRKQRQMIDINRWAQVLQKAQGTGWIMGLLTTHQFEEPCSGEGRFVSRMREGLWRIVGRTVNAKSQQS